MNPPREWNKRRKAEIQAAETRRLPPEPCPWCGREMEQGYLISGWSDIVWWSGSPSVRERLRRGAEPLKVDIEGCALKQHRTAWLCRDCGKMVFQAPSPWGSRLGLRL